MIVVDMDMPKYCGGCFYDDCPSRVYEEDKRPKDCPIKCDIEDIKAEIASARNALEVHGQMDEVHALNFALQVIDKHIKGGE